MRAALALAAFGGISIIAASIDNTILAGIGLAGAVATLILDHHYGGDRR